MAEGTIDVSVAADADTPSLTLQAASGTEDQAIALDIDAALNDTDGSESLAITISGVPEGATLSAGTDEGGGTWTLTPAQLTGLTITPPADSDTDFTLTVTATATESDGGDTATTQGTIDVSVAADADAPTLTLLPISGAHSSAIPMNISSALVDTDSSETLSIVVSHVPAGATLSAGTDHGNGSWTLTAEQLDGLTITPPHGDAADFTVTVTVSATEADGGDTAVTMGTCPVTVLAAPDAHNSVAIMPQDTPISGPLTVGDMDHSGTDLSCAVDRGPSNGQLTINADGTYDYTPHPGYVGGRTASRSV